MLHNIIRSYVVISTILIALPEFVGAHSDHPDEVAVNTTSGVVTSPMTLAIVIGAVLAGVVVWRLRDRVRKPRIVLSLLAFIIVGTVASMALTTNPNQQPSAAAVDLTAFTSEPITLYKDPNCGCCTGYADALRREGFEVTIEETRDMAAVKEAHNIPVHGESCHTSVIGEYVVEGHVPLEALEKLLAEQPDVAGIGLPSMPIGTPGMPGTKSMPYNVYQLTTDGAMVPYLTL